MDAQRLALREALRSWSRVLRERGERRGALPADQALRLARLLSEVEQELAVMVGQEAP